MIRPSAQPTSLHPPAQPPAALCSALSVLVVEAPGALRLLDTSRQAVVLTRLHMLNARMLAKVAPDAVVGPLIGDGWDSLDLAIALEEMGYHGNFYILTRPLPRAELIWHELRACCPGLTIALVATG